MKFSCKHLGLLPLALGALMCASSVRASGDFLSGYTSADNAFTVYLSTNDSVLGTAIATGNSWPTAYSLGNVALTPGQTYYLQVDAVNSGGPDGYIGTFTLNNTDFQFENGTQTLETDTVNWLADPATAGWTAPVDSPLSYGYDGTGPWGYQPSYDVTAQWIWSSPDNGVEAYFSTVITSTVPEPATWGILAGVAALGLAAVRRRRA